MSYKGIPKEIKFGHHTLVVLVRNGNEEPFIGKEHLYGYSNGKTNEIFIRSNIPASHARSTLFHELMHHVRFKRNVMINIPSQEGKGDSQVYEEWEHHFIELFEDSLLEILQDNPKLRKFLLKKEEMKK